MWCFGHHILDTIIYAQLFYGQQKWCTVILSNVNGVLVEALLLKPMLQKAQLAQSQQLDTQFDC